MKKTILLLSLIALLASCEKESATTRMTPHEVFDAFISNGLATGVESSAYEGEGLREPRAWVNLDSAMAEHYLWYDVTVGSEYSPQDAIKRH